MAILMLLSLLGFQDDPAKWISQLESDSIVEREEATRRLKAMGPVALERLGKAKEAARDPEIKARLEAIIAHIGKIVELARVLGPTRRVTIAARGRPLREILKDLQAPGVAGIDTGPLDPEARYDLQVRGVTWWEALDQVARAAGARYEIGEKEHGDDPSSITFVRGREREFPVVYTEQFRISVVETKRFEVRAPDGRTLAALAVVEVRHQPDIRPHDSWSGEGVKITSAEDAKGKDARATPLTESRNGVMENTRPLGRLGHVWIRADAPLPLTLTGEANYSFPTDTREITLDLDGDGSKVQAGPARISVFSFSSSKSGTLLRIRAEAKEVSDLEERIAGQVAVVVDSKGDRHSGSLRSTMGADVENCEWEFDFPSEITAPRKVALRWIAEFHQVKIPFRLEGVRLP